ncbi:MAG: hypothetical protein ISR84_02555 [Kiritimatiellales bacterium]|nr:hypothetical protein [Kiritimatiellales bacterium]
MTKIYSGLRFTLFTVTPVQTVTPATGKIFSGRKNQFLLFEFFRLLSFFTCMEPSTNNSRRWIVKLQGVEHFNQITGWYVF